MHMLNFRKSSHGLLFSVFAVFMVPVMKSCSSLVTRKRMVKASGSARRRRDTCTGGIAAEMLVMAATRPRKKKGRPGYRKALKMSL